MIVAGFGFRAEASLHSLREALRCALDETDIAGLPLRSLVLLATARDKAQASCLQDLAAELKLPICALTPAEMAAIATLTDSAPVRQRRGTGSVAEAAALMAANKLAGEAATLLHPRSVSPDRLAACALATFTSLPGTNP
ncbi:cobalamin biosynthesis protein [Hydrogenophaga intermedia]|uniref:cobalamin biosynthesis protein n=1 Tax=Hydrogenophaga intermedia TaxID=65786 RepID=UPI0020443BC9|nr:cobalamin biosynthesis protein [Hydrogenophaga intermedia]MCM3566028.1 cobalamin biosynthesis protein [Hydrogenophaga intermedia]